MRLVSIVVLFCVILAGAAALILASGPVEVSALRNRFAADVGAKLGPDYAVKVGGAVIDVDPVLGLVAQIDDVTITDSAKAVVARVPALRFAIDPLSFLRLRVDVTLIEVSEPEISLVLGWDGRVALGTAETIRPSDPSSPAPQPADATPVDPATRKLDGGFPGLFNALHTLDRALEPAIETAFARNFQRLSVDAATIRFFDAKKQQQRVLGHSDLSVTADADTGNLKANFSTSGYSGRWGLIADRSVDKETRDRTLSLSVSQVMLADIEPNFGRPESLMVSDIPLFGRATVRLGDNGDVKDANVRLDFGAGKFVSGFGKDTVLLDEATVRLRWDMAARAMVLDPSTFFFGDTRSVFTGEVKPIGEGGDGRYSYSFESKGSILSARDARAPAIIADRIALVGTADFPGKRIDFTDASLTTSVGSVAAAGTLGLEGATPSLAMAASFTPMSISALKQMWPPTLAGPARKWVMEHVLDGRVEAARFQASVPGGVLWTGERVTMPENYMRLDARLAGVSFNTIGTIPPLTNVSGNAVLAGSTFGVDMDKGQITAPSGKTLQITAGAFAVPNTALPVAEGQVEVQFEGNVGAMAEIANSEPMRAMTRNAIDPDNLSGNGQGSLSIKFPMKPALLPSDIDWRVGLKTTDFASAAPIEGKTIQNGTFAMTADANEVTIKGKATINGVPATIDLAKPLGSGTGDADLEGGRRRVQLTLDADARKRLGIGLDNVLGGTVSATINDLEGDRKGQHYDLDLKQARLVLQSVGWSKGIGVPAKLSFDILPKDDGFSVENMVATGDGFGLKGRAVLDAKYGLVSADIERFSLRKGDQVSMKLARKGNGYQISVRGAAFDVRSIVAQFKANTMGPNDQAPDISIDAKVDRLTGFGQVTLASASVQVQMTGGVVGNAAVSGVLPGGGVSMKYVDDGRNAKLDLTSADAGNLFAFIDIYRRISGGQLTVTGSRTGASGSFSGVFEVTDFSIVDETSMRKLVSATTGTGDDATPSGLDPAHVPFGRMRLDYTKRGSLLIIEDAVLRGASVGATFNGTLDLARQQVSLVGTYLPAYAFNNLFGRLPLIGIALGGGSKGGLFGVTFKVEGPISGPNLTVNPLSMITPGIFRKIFEFPVN